MFLPPAQRCVFFQVMHAHYVTDKVPRRKAGWLPAALAAETDRLSSHFNVQKNKIQDKTLTCTETENQNETSKRFQEEKGKLSFWAEPLSNISSGLTAVKVDDGAW